MLDTTQNWLVCYTGPGAERRAQDRIEKSGRGTFLPTFVRSGVCRARLCSVERPLLPRYVFVALRCYDDLSGLGDVDGVSDVLGTIPDHDIARMMMAHATGAFNVYHARAGNGRYAKRRRRPRPGKSVRNLTHSTRSLAA